MVRWHCRRKIGLICGTKHLKNTRLHCLHWKTSRKNFGVILHLTQREIMLLSQSQINHSKGISREEQIPGKRIAAGNVNLSILYVNTFQNVNSNIILALSLWWFSCKIKTCDATCSNMLLQFIDPHEHPVIWDIICCDRLWQTIVPRIIYKAFSMMIQNDTW